MAPPPSQRREHRHRHRSRLPYLRHRPASEISCCVKYMVFSFNIIFWMIGLGILIIGIYAQIEKNPLNQLGPRLSRFYLDPAWVLIFVGGLTFIIGFSGCVGALRENTCLLAVYATLVGVLLLGELIVGILGFVFKDSLKNQLEGELDEMIRGYRDDPDLQSVVDWIQGEWLHCCGLHGPNDWDKNIYFNKSSEALGSPEAGGVPFSCCASDDKDRRLKNLFCGHKVRRPDYEGSQVIYQSGCLDSGQAWLNKNIVIVGSVAVAIAVVEILGICFAQNLRSDIFAQRARWERSR